MPIIGEIDGTVGVSVASVISEVVRLRAAFLRWLFVACRFLYGSRGVSSKKKGGEEVVYNRVLLFFRFLSQLHLWQGNSQIHRAGVRRVCHQTNSSTSTIS